MATARLLEQIVATGPTKLGLLADITGELRVAGINIEDVMAHEMDGGAQFWLVTSDNARATAALGALGFDVRLEPVVAVEVVDVPGALDEIATRTAEAGINITWLYASTASGTANVMLKTEDDEKVVGLF
jgi:hypothetical protein